MHVPNLSVTESAPQGGARRPLSARLTLVIGALCAFGILWWSESTYQRAAQTLNQVEGEVALRAATGAVMRRMLQAESGQRGFIVTGSQAYLDHYRSASSQIDGLLRELDRRAAEVALEPIAVRNFSNAVAQKLTELDLSLRLQTQQKQDAAEFFMTSDASREQMETVQREGEALVALSNATMADKRAELRRLMTLSRVGLVAGVLMAFLAFLLYVRQARTLSQADQRQQRLLEAERDALESQVRERTARLTELATYLQQAVEDERAHLARELHDELGALLTAAKLTVARIKSKLPEDATEVRERLAHLTETLNQGIALKRRIIEDLRPSSLSNLGLVASLEILTREFAERSDIEVETALEPVHLDTASELSVYRTVQEALTNIGKYANASKVTVILKNYVYHAEVTVRDNGVGFDPSHLPQASHGLLGMRHRIEAGGGRLDIDSRPNAGTRITATLPRHTPKPQPELEASLDAMSAEAYKAPPPPLTPPNPAS